MGVSRDLANAIESAESGDAEAMRQAGRLLEADGDLVGAELWYRRSIDSGNTAAMNNVGLLLKNRGELDDAEQFFRKAAAEAENDAAMSNLGDLLWTRAISPEPRRGTGKRSNAAAATP